MNLEGQHCAQGPTAGHRDHRSWAHHGHWRRFLVLDTTGSKLKAGSAHGAQPAEIQASPPPPGSWVPAQSALADLLRSPRAPASLTRFYFLTVETPPQPHPLKSFQCVLFHHRHNVFNCQCCVSFLRTSLGTRQVSPARCCIPPRASPGSGTGTVLPGKGMEPTADRVGVVGCSGQGPTLEGCSPMAPDGRAGKNLTQGKTGENHGKCRVWTPNGKSS